MLNYVVFCINVVAFSAAFLVNLTLVILYSFTGSLKFDTNTSIANKSQCSPQILPLEISNWAERFFLSMLICYSVNISSFHCPRGTSSLIITTSKSCDCILVDIVLLSRKLSKYSFCHNLKKLFKSCSPFFYICNSRSGLEISYNISGMPVLGFKQKYLEYLVIAIFTNIH